MPWTGRRLLMYNTDCAISVARPTQAMDYFYRNARAMSCYSSTGPGHAGDDLWHAALPRGRLSRDPARHHLASQPETGEQRFLVVEAFGGRDPAAQALSQRVRPAPRALALLRARPAPAAPSCRCMSERGEFHVRVKVNGRDHGSTRYDFHPLDLVGWDGYLYPYAFNIDDFEPITGRVHQPPPVHQTFEGPNFVVCSFCPRKLDYHPQAVPVPYNHSNIDSDEVIYYVSGNSAAARHRGQLDYTAPTRNPAWTASRHRREEPGRRADRRAGGDGRYLPPAQARCGCRAARRSELSV